MASAARTARHRYEALLSVYKRRFEHGRRIVLADNRTFERLLLRGRVHKMLVDLSTLHQVASGGLFLAMDSAARSAHQKQFLRCVNLLSSSALVPPLCAIMRAKRAADKLYRSLAVQQAQARKEERLVAPAEECVL